ncbi:MAG TPA: hypothetical protein VI874_04315 [Candidatus Norongarragalinales archaeon]|nr:hypothetical protein [Candidatus Norongarragalinales archaeon]
MQFPNLYTSKNYKLLLILPIVLILASLALVPGVPKGIDLRGGLLITIQTDQAVDEAALASAIKAVSKGEPLIRSYESPAGKGYEIELPLKLELDDAAAFLAQARNFQEQWEKAEVELSQGRGSESAAKTFGDQSIQFSRQSAQKVGKTITSKTPTEALREADDAVAESRSDYRDTLLASVQKIAPATSVSVREVGSSLSTFFLAKTQQVVLTSFLLLAVIVFILFRSIGPSLAVMIGPLTNITMTAGAMSILQIPWSLASVAAMLMLVGFSLDTYMMLTIRILKRPEDDAPTRANDAVNTAFLMNAATVAAYGVLTFLATLLTEPTYFQIGAVATLGGMADFITTRFFNAPLLLWMHERKTK